MRLWAVVGCVLFCVLVTDAYFDCRRKGLQCAAGFCNFFGDGSCINCGADIAGVDCGYNTSDVRTDCGANFCKNGGTCIDVDGKPGCYCDSDYFGDNCERKRAEIECNGENMTVTITPYPGFQGVIYFKGSEDDDNCTFTSAKDGNIQYFESTQPLGSGCNALVKKDTPAVGDSTYIRSVIVRYNPNTVTSVDQNVEAKCEHKAANVTDLETSMSSVIVDQATNLTQETAETTYDPVLVEIQTEEGDKLKGNTYIGRKLRLHISLRDTAKYKTINVESCLVFNGKTGADRKEQKFIDNSCPALEAAAVISKPMERNAGQSAVMIYFKAFKFMDSNDIEFECKVRTCQAGDNSCAPRDCWGMVDTGLGRRKRDTEDADLQPKEEIIISKKIRVLDPGARTTITEAENDSEDCLQRKEIFSSIIILSSAVVVLLFTCFILAFKMIRSRSSKFVHNESEFTGSSVSSDGSRIRIPRVRAVF